MTDDRSTYTFTSEPRGDVYRALVEVAAGFCSSALLVVRDGLGLSEAASQILEKLGPHLESKGRESAWPGTELLGHEATVYRFKLAPEARWGLATAAAGLFDWRQPDRPEDLCLLRSDGSAWLGSIAHERDAFLSLSAEEVRRLEAEAPAIWALLARDPES